MDGKKLSVGCYIKWDADRMFKSWNTYGKVIKISRGNVTIVTYDDFVETTISRNGEAVTDEITLATKSDIERYIATRKASLIYKKSELEFDYVKSVNDIDEKIENLSNITL